LLLVIGAKVVNWTFITYVISFLLLFLFRILVKNIFEKYLQVANTNQFDQSCQYADANAISVANALKTEKPARFNVIALLNFNRIKQVKVY
jgi:hypothetical protein